VKGFNFLTNQDLAWMLLEMLLGNEPPSYVVVIYGDGFTLGHSLAWHVPRKLICILIVSLCYS